MAQSRGSPNTRGGVTAPQVRLANRNGTLSAAPSPSRDQMLASQERVEELEDEVSVLQQKLAEARDVQLAEREALRAELMTSRTLSSSQEAVEQCKAEAQRVLDEARAEVMPPPLLSCALASPLSVALTRYVLAIEAAADRAEMVAMLEARIDKERRRAEGAEAKVVQLEEKLFDNRQLHLTERSELRAEADEAIATCKAVELELSYTRKERDRATKAEEQARLRAQDAEEHGELYRREVSRLKDEVEELTPVKRELEEHRRYGEAQMLEAKAVARNEAEALAHEVPRACSISRRLSATEGIVLCCR